MKYIISETQSDKLKEHIQYLIDSELDNIKNESDDEDVWLDDSSGDLSGQIVKKIDYVKDMLAMVVKKQDWSMVGRAINYLRIKL